MRQGYKFLALIRTNPMRTAGRAIKMRTRFTVGFCTVCVLDILYAPVGASKAAGATSKQSPTPASTPLEYRDTTPFIDTYKPVCPPLDATQATRRDIQTSTMQALRAINPANALLPAVRRSVAIGNYALAGWAWGAGTGQAALIKSRGVWRVVALGGPMFG